MKFIKKIGRRLYKDRFLILAWGLFFLTRLLILKFPPPFYSDVSHDYERYANIWWYGLPPYLKHYYEYPPGTIPLLLFPLWLDLSGLGVYYLNYRLQIFGLEILLFGWLLKALRKLNTSFFSKYLAVSFYCLIGLVAKDFWYEGLDLVFIGAYVAALVFWYLNRRDRFLLKIASWLFFWLSIALKFMSGPLLLLFWAIQKSKWKRNLLAALAGFIIVWGVPLAIFRSSLSVSLVFHLNRGAKYASFPSFIIEVVNQFTGTEVRLDQPPDFQFVGPVTDRVLHFFSPLFFVGIILINLGFFYKLTKKREVKNLETLLRYSLIYILFVFLTGKVFSSPFHIWLIPLITIFPFKKIKQQLLAMFLVLYMVILDTTPWIRLPEIYVFKPISLNLILGATRFVPMIILLSWFSWRSIRQPILKKNKGSR